MKRAVIGIVVLTFLSMLTYYQITCAADTFEVSADNSKTKIIEDDRYLIPVNLYENSGIMGFRVMLAYDSKKIRIISISRGVITAEGNFAANISAADGIADIIWNDTADVKTKNGSLFFMTVEKLSDDLSIDMSFSQPDTFNEKYKDVCLKCKKIDIKNDVQTKVEDAKLAGSEESVKPQNADELSDAATGEEDNSGADYGSHADISSESKAEANALYDYVKSKDEEVNNVSESEEELKVGELSEAKKKEQKTIQDIPDDNKAYIAIILGVVILMIVVIFCKKYAIKNTEGKDEEKN